MVQGLVAAIGKRESGGEKDPYKAKGIVINDPKNAYYGDRAYGKYQVMGKNIPQWTKEIVGREYTPDEFLNDPAVQDKVAQTRLSQYKQKTGSDTDAAAMWFSGRPLAESANAKDPLGTTTQQYTQDVARLMKAESQNLATSGGMGQLSRDQITKNIEAMEQQGASQQEVQGYLDSLRGQQTQQPQQGGGMIFEPPKRPEVSRETQEVALQEPEQDKNIVQKGLEFLFPVLEKKERTPLQWAGDIGMSVLPFIPGLGQAGLLAKGARAVGLASKAAKGAKAAKTAGLVSRVARSPVAQGVAAGYGTGVSKNLSEGEALGESFKPNVNTVGGAVLGGGAATVAKAAGGIINKAAGIPANIRPRLANLSNKGLYDTYARVGAKRAEDAANPSLIDYGVQRATKAVDKIQTALKQSQKEIGEVIKKESATKMKDVTPVIQDFAKKLEERFGVRLRISKTGAISFAKAQGRMKDVLSVADKRRVRDALTDLMKLRKTGNIRKASDVLDNLDNAISYGKKTYFGGTDPLNAFLKETRHSLNQTIGKNAPKLAEAKAKARALHDVIDEIEAAGGSNFQRADLLLKRALSGDKDAIPRQVFKTIKDETGIDLMDDAILINHFSRSLGDDTQLSLLSQYLNRAATQGGTTLTDIGLDLTRKGLMSTVADPIKMGRNIVRGKKGLVPTFLDTIPTGAGIEASRFLSQ